MDALSDRACVHGTLNKGLVLRYEYSYSVHVLHPYPYGVLRTESPAGGKRQAKNRQRGEYARHG